MLKRMSQGAAVVALLFSLASCGDDGEGESGPPALSIYGVANGCYSVVAEGGARLFLSRSSDSEFVFSPNAAQATPFFLKASRLGAYLLRDESAGYFVSDGVDLQRS